jgi:polysaccharide biosynthesis/export protein
MTTTYTKYLSPLFRLFPNGFLTFSFLFVVVSVSLIHGQSLEDKVSQARKLQAQSMMGLDEQTMDSILAEKKGSRINRQEKEKTIDDGQVEAEVLDSMIAGPNLLKDRASDLKEAPAKKEMGKDSLGEATTKTSKKLPKRYEQRIFGTVDRTAFSGARGSVGRDYVLAPGDQFMVFLWGDKEKEYNLELNGEGKVFLEGVGLIALAGMNINEAQKVIQGKLAKIYSGITRGTAHVEASLAKAGPIKVFVLGEVKVPGGYVFTGNTSVLSALYYAQGPNDIGTVRNLQLSRAGKKYSLDLYKYLIYGQGLVPEQLRDGDILFSSRAESLVEIDGDVGRPATYELKKGEGLKELLEFARGLNPTAAAQKMTLQRFKSGGQIDFIDLAAPQEYLSGQLKMELQDGDKVTIRKSTELSKNFLTISGPVKYPGTYPFETTPTLQDLILKAGGLREDAFLKTAHIVRFKPDGSSQLFAYSLDSTAIQSIRLEGRDNVLLYSVKDMYSPDSVEISGAVFNPGKYEFREGMTARDLVMQAGGYLPEHEAGKILIFSGSSLERKVNQLTLTLNDEELKPSENYRLKPQDIVQVPVDPRWYKKEVVILEGLFTRPGKYALLYPGEKLVSVIQRASGFKDNAYIAGGRFFRSRDSVGRVGVDIQKAWNRPRSKANIALVGGDSIFIPERLNTVKVIGEVGFETSILFEEGASVQYYLERAGGLTRRSEEDRIVVQYANGESSRDGYFNRKPDAGSVIYVPQGPEPKPIDWVSGTNILLGTMTAGVTLILLTIQLLK